MLKAIIKGIDKHGFDGRDFFPKDSDIGTTVTVLYVETQNQLAFDSQSFFKSSVEDLRSLSQDELTYQLYLCLTEDGRKLELVGHEIEVLPS